MIVRTNNGYPSLTADGKVRACCCGCLDVRFNLLFGRATIGSPIDCPIYNPTGNHSMNAVIDAASTQCGALSFSITNDTLEQLVNRNVSETSCEGSCGEARLSKAQSLVSGRIAYPGPAHGNAFTCEYQCNRIFTHPSGCVPAVWFRFGTITVSGLPAGIQIRAQYRTTGRFPDSRVWLDISQDGTYGDDPQSFVVSEPGTFDGNQPVYAEIFFT